MQYGQTFPNRNGYYNIFKIKCLYNTLKKCQIFIKLTFYSQINLPGHTEDSLPYYYGSISYATENGDVTIETSYTYNSVVSPFEEIPAKTEE